MNTFGGPEENGSGEATLADKELILWNSLLADLELVAEWLKRRHDHHVNLTYNKEDLVIDAVYEGHSSASNKVRSVLKVQLHRPKKLICVQRTDRAKGITPPGREKYKIKVNSLNGNLYFQSRHNKRFDSMTLAENLLAEKLCLMFLTS